MDIGPYSIIIGTFRKNGQIFFWFQIQVELTKKFFISFRTVNCITKKHLKSTAKYGGGTLMLYACFVYGGSGPPVKINSVFSFAKYCNISAPNVVVSSRGLGNGHYYRLFGVWSVLYSVSVYLKWIKLLIAWLILYVDCVLWCSRLHFLIIPQSDQM